MKRSLKLILLVLVAGVFTWLAFGFFGIQALFTNKEVNEAIPDAVSGLIADASPANAEEDSSQRLLGQGSFEQGDSTYTITGDAYLSQIDGALNLTLTDFEVSNGPDLYLYAVKTRSTDNQTVKQTVADGGFVRLGTLKGNIGTQSYQLEAEFDPSEYGVIAVWCQRFSRNFGSAHLIRP